MHCGQSSSSTGRNINHQYSTLWLNGGYNCTIEKSLRVDLRVSGGAFIKKDLCVLGNVSVAGILVSNICTEEAYLSRIIAKNAAAPILVSGNVDFMDTITTPDACITKLRVGSICGKDSNSISVDSDLCVNQTLVVGNVAEKIPGSGVTFLNDINAGNINVSGVLCGNVKLDDLTVNGDLIIPGTIFGNVDGDHVSDTTINGNLTVTQDINVNGTFVAPKFVGDLQGNLCGDTTVFGNLKVLGDTTVVIQEFIGNLIGDIFGDTMISGNLTPSIPDTFNLGSSTNKFLNLYVQHANICADTNIAGNLTVGDKIIGDVTVDGILTASSFIGNVQGDTVVNGTVTATKFIGDLQGNLCADSTVLGDLTVTGTIFATTYGGTGPLVVDSITVNDFNTPNEVVYVGVGGELMVEAGFEYSDTLNKLDAGTFDAAVEFQVGGQRVVTARQGAIASLTDSTTGTVSNTLGPLTTILNDQVGGNASVTSTQAAIDDIADSIASLNDQVNRIILALEAHGLIA